MKFKVGRGFWQRHRAMAFAAHTGQQVTSTQVFSPSNVTEEPNKKLPAPV